MDHAIGNQNWSEFGQAIWPKDQRISRHFIALTHKEPRSGYGVSFPDVPGVIAVADSLDEALEEASSVLAFAFEDWHGAAPVPRSLDDLRHDPKFLSDSADAIAAAVRPGAAFSAAA